MGAEGNPCAPKWASMQAEGALPLKSLGVQGGQEGAPTVTGHGATMQDGCTHLGWEGISQLTVD